MVVLYRRQDLNEGEFQAYLREVHGPMAEAVPNLLHYTDRETMEAAWASPEGQAATADLAEFADLSRSTWSLVGFHQRR
jgi:hypothetical protein